MGRIIGIDYGGKRTGIAVTDPLQITANALTTVHSARIFEYLDQYLEKENVEILVVGYPLNLDGTETDATPLVKGFMRKLKKRYSQCSIVMWDESYTSKKAIDTMVETGVSKKKRQSKALVDQVSAVIILQSYLGLM